ncbi:hypothetical protein [Nevskia sp.]|uniref:hypothetical protein n=1 Tax=Nevskia sp. TaxID=1929292 RepID=UPI0025DFF6BE|nr:hypothetical protein [Nevskia sp.]
MPPENFSIDDLFNDAGVLNALELLEIPAVYLDDLNRAVGVALRAVTDGDTGDLIPTNFVLRFKLKLDANGFGVPDCQSEACPRTGSIVQISGPPSSPAEIEAINQFYQVVVGRKVAVLPGVYLTALRRAFDVYVSSNSVTSVNVDDLVLDFSLDVAAATRPRANCQGQECPAVGNLGHG